MRKSPLRRWQGVLRGTTFARIFVGLPTEASAKVNEAVPLRGAQDSASGDQPSRLANRTSAKVGGGQGSRTPDPYVANVVLSQLS